MAEINSLGEFLCVEIARATIAELAFDELEFFDQLAKLEKNAPAIRDEVLAFGIVEVLQVLTPTILTVVQDALCFVAPKLFDATLDIGKDAAKDAIRRRLAKQAGGEALPIPVSFTQEQLKALHDTALRQCSALGLKDNRSQQIVNAIVANLALL